MHNNQQHSKDSAMMIPRVIAWEVTRQCHLKCQHCRAAAQDCPYDNELTTEECFKVLDSIAAFASPVIIFTGGEPMLRSDIFELISYASKIGCKPVLAPCGKYLNEETVQKLKKSGCLGVSISIDAPTEELHDLFRGVKGAFAGALNGIEELKKGNIPFQINTVVTKENKQYLPQMVDLAMQLGAHTLDLFFLVPTGRAIALKQLELSMEEYEETLLWIYKLNQQVEINLKTTCAPHFARVQDQNANLANATMQVEKTGVRRPVSGGCMGGKGFVFISHIGELQPCGFLELECGNLRDYNYDFQNAYKTSPQFLALRQPTKFVGKCGSCRYSVKCSGCRARAAEETGNYLDSEPRCQYNNE